MNNDETLAKDQLHSYRKLAEDTYIITEGEVANTFLLLGRERALLIDSGIGLGNIKETVQEITSLPTTLVLTHNHCDHSGGKDWFNEYYMNENDDRFVYNDILSSKIICRIFVNTRKEYRHMPFLRKPYHSQRKTIKDGYIFDLGGREVECINTPGHTYGSIVLRDEKTKILFTGDNVNPWLWLQLPGATTISKWLIGAKRTEKMALGYTIWNGHQTEPLSKDDVHHLIEVGEDILKHQDDKHFKKKIIEYPNGDAPYHIRVKRKNIR